MPNVVSTDEATTASVQYFANASNGSFYSCLPPYVSPFVSSHPSVNVRYAPPVLGAASLVPSFPVLSPFSLPSYIPQSLPYIPYPHPVINPPYIPDRHTVTNPLSVQARQKRRKRLDQRLLARQGPFSASNSISRCGQFDEAYVQALKVSHPGRSNYGPPTYRCPHCKALFWLREGLRQGSARRNGQPIYNNCCKAGRVIVPPFQPRPEPLASLARFDGDARCNKFMKHIRQYNCLFAFTSMGAKIDRSVNDGRGPPIFKISGQVHHRIGSLLPQEGLPPKFIQLYVYDTTNEVSNRIHALDPSESSASSIDPSIVQSLVSMLDEHNPFAREFRKARDRLQSHGDQEFAIRIAAPAENDPPQYNLPTTNQLAILVVNDFTVDAFQRDIIVETQSAELRQISALHPAFMPLQYPLLFPYGEPGFQSGVLYEDAAADADNARVKITMQDYYRYMLHYREDQPNPYLCYGSLSSQIKVDARACIDESRLFYILEKQDDIRVESIQGISDAVNRGCVRGSETGKVTVLPASFTGGRRYMMQNYHDAIAICRKYGPPDFFITFTCNPNWPEITEGMLEVGQRSTDRSDVTVRVFHMKLEELLHDLQHGTLFGTATAVLHTVEFQKRGLPHAHIILWTKADTSEPTPSLIDSFISAEIPDPVADPLGYVLVAEHMTHGPCGPLNTLCPCMKKGKCSKFYPKPHLEETTVDKDGFASYRRRPTELFIQKGGHCLDNRWIVPHNLVLLKKYQAHINVEWCNKTIFVKYLFKYVTKSADSSKAYIERVRTGQDAPYDKETDTRNEIKEYLNCRYICEFDACWRILGYDIHRHYPPVERMPVHLANENFISYSARAKIKTLLEEEFLRRTMLTQWFAINQRDATARELTYSDFPSRWKWEPRTRTWEQRRHNRRKIGRLHYVHPSAGERYYLRLLLLTVKGCTSFEDIRFYDGVQHPTFKEACRARGLIGDDQEWYAAFDEAAAWATASHLRKFFVTMVLFCGVVDECSFFERVWRLLGDDIQYQFTNMMGSRSYQLSDTDIRDGVLEELARIFSDSGKDINDYRLPRRTVVGSGPLHNRLIMQELSYSANDLSDGPALVSSLNAGQLRAFNTIVDTVQNSQAGFFFVSGFGGTGKTYLWNCICSHLRAQRKIVLTVASSGVASLLLPGGRTAHSRFIIPCDLTESSVCGISRGTMLGRLIQAASLIIWDEALMTDRRAFEALDRTLRDIESEYNPEAHSLPFGGKVVVLGGDIRQILPVVEGGNRVQIVGSAIFNSHLWSSAQVLHLTENMRLAESSHNSTESQSLAEFGRWILDIGEGKVPSVARDGESEPSWIEIPEDLLIPSNTNTMSSIVEATYPDFATNYKSKTYLKQRAILTPTNELADFINDHVVSSVPSEAREYLSSDTISKQTQGHETYQLLYPDEFLNSLDGNNFPKHKIPLKVGVPIMLLRNLNQTDGLCNGTRLIITQLGHRVIEAKMITGDHEGDIVLIPRISLTLKSNKYPFELVRRQFPIRICYAMTINKSQGQTLSHVGIYLKRPVFSHGQLYVAVSRVTSKEGLKIAIEDESGNSSNQTRNVVYSEVFAAFNLT